jgi:hypothetical protein
MAQQSDEERHAAWVAAQIAAAQPLDDEDRRQLVALFAPAEHQHGAA